MTSSSVQLASIYEAEEGLENRLVNYMKEATSFLDLMEKMKNKAIYMDSLTTFLFAHINEYN
ncbi:nucleotidyltransferase family protein [Anaerobacillus sp. HL2]|nr:nucleotidyltransferase family protein [Anaerobacillus sp. HL2]